MSYKGKKILAIIPARGGSKGLPGKNIKELCGKPLINWSIDLLKEIEIIDRIFVSTDSSEIANVAKNDGVEIPFLRNQHLAKDNSLVIDAVLEAYDYFKKSGEYYDLILLVEPTSPLRTKDIVIECIQNLVNSNKNSIATFSELEVPYERIWIIKNNNASTITHDNTGFKNRQSLHSVYKLNGLLYGIKTEALLAMNKPQIITDDVIPYLTDRNISTDIDDINDFNYIEYCLKNGK